MATVLITGSSQGIGLATAIAFARAGYQVAASVQKLSASTEIATIAEKEKLDIRVYQIDVDSDSSVNEGVSQILNETGSIDVLVNNAGIERMGTVEDVGLADFRAVMETNYFGVIRCVQAVLPGMRKRRSGCIINITSIAGRFAVPAMSAYAASKYALECLSETLAQEVKSFGIRVAIVEPGIINTAMAQHVTTIPEASNYPHTARLSALFSASLKNPVPPSVVADKIVEIASINSEQLRYPVGPDALPFLGWRQSMSDEEWVTLGSSEDDDWYKRVEADFGMPIRPVTEQEK